MLVIKLYALLQTSLVAYTHYETGNIRVTYHCDAFAWTLLLRKSNDRFSLHCLLGLHVTVKNVKVFIVATEMQQCVSFTLLSCCNVFCTAINNKKYLLLHVKYPIFCPLLTTFFFYFHDTSPNIKISRKFVQWSRCYVTPCSPANKTYHYVITS